MITLPTTSGWTVSWYTGETRTRKDGRVIRFQNSYESTSKEKVEAKAKELAEQGYEIAYITECIF